MNDDTTFGAFENAISERAAHPSVTCVVLAYNHAQYVVEALDSAFAQTYPNLRIIVTEDASTDDTADVIRKYLARTGHDDVTFIAHKRNKGLCATLNEVLTHIDSDYVAFISADDTQEPNRFDTQVALMDELGPKCGFCYSDMNRIGVDGHRLAASFYNGLIPPSGNSYLSLIRFFNISTPSVLIRTAALDDIGAYDEELPSEDYDMFLRITKKYEIAYIPDCLVSYRVTPSSLYHQLRSNPLRNWQGRKRILIKHLNGPSTVHRAVVSKLVEVAKEAYLDGVDPKLIRTELAQYREYSTGRADRFYRWCTSLNIPGTLVRQAVLFARSVKTKTPR